MACRAQHAILITPTTLPHTEGFVASFGFPLAPISGLNAGTTTAWEASSSGIAVKGPPKPISIPRW